MLPESFIDNAVTVDMPSKTFKIDWVNNRIEGFIDGREAIAQSVELAVTTERYIWDIYSWNYGSEIYTLIGKPEAYAMSEMKRMIGDALSTDSRVTDISNYVFKKTQDGITCDFTVKSIAGDVSARV